MANNLPVYHIGQNTKTDKTKAKSTHELNPTRPRIIPGNHGSR